ncbi:hypothetical protein DFP72DRAFT_257041 [Ephemerocybe angulata]|uniref:Uncharacterized protein n=1 Tax=Ephemerocybe angulata TaxID=980116 RepID=A0A8H6H8N5_9AGAR|nr:hypothetical protein DFP72DRAFT_257041 [Tulosesus angulatus]
MRWVRRFGSLRTIWERRGEEGIKAETAHRVSNIPLPYLPHPSLLHTLLLVAQSYFWTSLDLLAISLAMIVVDDDEQKPLLVVPGQLSATSLPLPTTTTCDHHLSRLWIILSFPHKHGCAEHVVRTRISREPRRRCHYCHNALHRRHGQRARLLRQRRFLVIVSGDVWDITKPRRSTHHSERRASAYTFTPPSTCHVVTVPVVFIAATQSVAVDGGFVLGIATTHARRWRRRTLLTADRCWDLAASQGTEHFAVAHCRRLDALR